MSDPFRYACPACHRPLESLDADSCLCPLCQTGYRRVDGIWRLLPVPMRQEYQQFIHEYQLVRKAEGRGSSDPAYYRELPYRDLTGKFASDWRIRARSFDALLRSIVIPLENQGRSHMKILDLGAGNGWLSYRLAQRGHSVAAVDLQADPLDGLGAHIHYDQPFTPVEADYDHLPFCENQVDVIVYNASFHYSTHYETSLAEALRVLRPDGRVIILDSPIYHNAGSGIAMVRERRARFMEMVGLSSDALESENYLTYRRLEELGKRTGLRWRLIRVFYGWGWATRPLRAKLAGRREPAQFRIAAGQRI